jgi:tetratricopeptide (TPR) repeat protein
MQASLSSVTVDRANAKKSTHFRTVARAFRALSALSFAAIIASCSSPSFQGKSVSALGEVIEEKAIQEKAIQEKSPTHQSMPTHPKSRLKAHRSTGASVVGQPAPDCELTGLEPNTVDVDLWARLKLDYKRHCYEQAVRTRPRLLDVARIQPLVEVTAGGERGKPVPGVVTPAATNAPVDANFYCEKAIAEYRDGDFVQALIDFDLVIWVDPNFEDAYINRGIILYRMRHPNLAFDDIIHALRIESSHRIEHPPLPKPSPLPHEN